MDRHDDRPDYLFALRDKMLARMNNVWQKDSLPEINIDALSGALERLTPERYKQIILMRFRDKRSLLNIGNQLSISKERVRCLEIKAMFRLYRMITQPVIDKTHDQAPERRPLIEAGYDGSAEIDVLHFLSPTLKSKLCANDYDKIHKLCGACPADLMMIKGVGESAVERIRSSLLCFQRRYPDQFHMINDN